MAGEPLFKMIFTAIDARIRCGETGNREWRERWSERLKTLESFLPSGGGFDSGSQIQIPDVRPKQESFSIVTAFHHMNDGGIYDGWTQHVVTLRPSFQGSGFTIRVSGKDRNGIKDYIAETFHHALTELHAWEEVDA